MLRLVSRRREVRPFCAGALGEEFPRKQSAKMFHVKHLSPHVCAFAVAPRLRVRRDPDKPRHALTGREE